MHTNVLAFGDGGVLEFAHVRAPERRLQPELPEIVV